MFDGRFREAVDRGVKPVGAALQRAGITADVLTALGLATAAAAAVAIATGWWWLAILLLIATGAGDLLDGAVAKASRTSRSTTTGLRRYSRRTAIGRTPRARSQSNA